MPVPAGMPASRPSSVSTNPEGRAGESGASDQVYGGPAPPVPVNWVVYAVRTVSGWQRDAGHLHEHLALDGSEAGTIGIHYRRVGAVIKGSHMKL